MIEVDLNWLKLILDLESMCFSGTYEDFNSDDDFNSFGADEGWYFMTSLGIRYNHFNPISLGDESDMPSKWSWFFGASFSVSGMIYILEFGINNPYSEYNILNTPVAGGHSFEYYVKIT